MVRGVCGLMWTGVDCGERYVWSDVDCGERYVWSDVDKCGLW